MDKSPIAILSRQFVRRESELGILLDLVDGPGSVAVVHGIAGVGKSALLREFQSAAAGRGAVVLDLDCRVIEPTERGLLAAVGGAADVDAFARELRSAPGPVVISVDHYEVFRLMDSWLRQVLMPRLPPNVTLVVAGRERPVAGWFAVPGFRTLPLGRLDDDHSRKLLEGIGARSGDVERLIRISRGHPLALALVLAAAGVSEHPELALEDAALTRVLDVLTRLFLDDVKEPQTRRALEAMSVVRRATGQLLSAMLEIQDVDDVLDDLRRLPFVDTCRDGLVVHEAVRDSIAVFLRGANPARYRRYRRAAWRELRAESRDAASAELWRYTADMLYLIDNPVVREAFFPSGTQPLAVEPAVSDEFSSLSAITHRHEGPEAAGLIDRWWEVAPDAFSAIRDRDGGMAGFFVLLNADRLRRSAIVRDPVAMAWVRDLREHPLPVGQTVLGLRRWLDDERGELPCASQAACWLDVKREYMALRPSLRRMYVVVRAVPTYWPVVQKLGFRPLAHEPDVLDGAEYTTVVLDFGPGSVDGWLPSLVATELGLAGEERILDGESHELVVRGDRIALTPLEFGVLHHLSAREGRTVTRNELLRDVWGTDYSGGSNVVDAVVRTLRGKLGEGASCVETVRGSGYRLRTDWQLV